MKDIREGGCLCGKARYSIDIADGYVGNCHCVTCRRHSGAPYETYITVPAGQFQWASEPVGYVQTGKTSGRFFCKDCGTPLSFVSDDEPDTVNITVGTIDDPSGMIPVYEIFTVSRMAKSLVCEPVKNRLVGFLVQHQPLASDVRRQSGSW